MQTKQDWEAWHTERERFKARGTEGFTKDIAALHAHILKLQEVCPKDRAGFPVYQALDVLDALQADYNRYSRLLEQLR